MSTQKSHHITKNGVGRFLSRREKKSKPVVKNDITKDILHLFHLDEKKMLSRSEEKTLQAGIQEVTKKLEALNITQFKEPQIEYALRSVAATGNVEKALDLLTLFRDTISGEIKPIDPQVTMIGAVNREFVTCYIDSLLFAMFARLDSFESILSVEFTDPAANTLAIIIRFWVNMLRTGRLITTDITKHLQEALGDCGWDAARKLAQQDVSEAFTFITDRLALPLLTLKMDVYHTGKEDTDDHRIVRERLLDVAIPEPPADGSSINLEDCLENYFNNKVEVKRHLQRRNTINARPIPKVDRGEVELVENVADPASRSAVKESLFRHHPLDSPESSKQTRDDIGIHPGHKDTPRATVFKKEVLMPAWQFFHLIPWFAPSPTNNDQVASDSQVAAHFATRKPMLGICLKRYSVTLQGVTKRLNTHIDIPLEIRLPHFYSDGSEDDGWGSSFSKFKLSLQSVICHRGASIEAGHYVCLAKPVNNEPNLANEIEDVPIKYRWLLFDDLAKDKRVKFTDIRKSLKDETPYLVFYQVQPVDENDELLSFDDVPPSYAEATVHSAPPTISSSVNHVSSHPPSTVLGSASITSSPPTTVQSTPLLTSTRHLLPSDIDSISLPLITSEAPSLNTVSQTSSQILGSDQPPEQTSLQHTTSLPPMAPGNTLDVTHPARPHSFDIPNPSLPKQPRTSTESDRKRFSVAFTDNTSGPSAPITPADETSDTGGYVDAKPPSSTPSLLTSMKIRGRTKDKQQPDIDEAKREKRHSSRSWLSVTGSVRARTRPVSQPPGNPTSVENRRSLVVLGGAGGMFKDLRKAMNRDSKGGDESTGLDSESGASAAVENNHLANDEAVSTTPKKDRDSKDLKDLKDSKGVSRRKSNRKGKARKEVSPSGGTKDGIEGPDRQCLVM